MMAASCAGPATPDAPTSGSVSSITATTEPADVASAPPTRAPATSTSGVSPTSVVLAPFEGVTIVLDPGHNGMNWAHLDEINTPVDIGTITKACNTTGAATADGFPEATFNWEVALLTRTRLESLGATVILTRPDNDGWGPCITERAAIGNRSNAAAVISIHADGGPESGAPRS